MYYIIIFLALIIMQNEMVLVFKTNRSYSLTIPLFISKVLFAKYLSEADTNNSFACGDGLTCYIKFSCSTFCVFYPMRNINFCFVLKTTT